jgi:hypothetical protein
MSVARAPLERIAWKQIRLFSTSNKRRLSSYFESRVARRIDEGDPPAAAAPLVQDHGEGADVLGDAAELAVDDPALAQVVQQRRLAVVDVTFKGNN